MLTNRVMTRSRVTIDVNSIDFYNLETATISYELVEFFCYRLAILFNKTTAECR